MDLDPLIGSYIIIVLASAIVGGVVAWTFAPEVGGEWWPYIHMAATVLGAIVGAKIGWIIVLAHIMLGADV